MIPLVTPLASRFQIVSLNPRHNERTRYSINYQHAWRDINTIGAMPTETRLRAKWLTTADLVKCTPIVHTHWSSGMISALIFAYDDVYSKKFLNRLNARRDWAVWKYAEPVIWSCTAAEIARFTPWSIRVRRFFTIASSTGVAFSVINFNNHKFVTPRRRIKRWLKKKYTTQSWR